MNIIELWGWFTIGYCYLKHLRENTLTDNFMTTQGEERKPALEPNLIVINQLGAANIIRNMDLHFDHYDEMAKPVLKEFIRKLYNCLGQESVKDERTAYSFLYEYGIDLGKTDDHFNSQLLFAMERYKETAISPLPDKQGESDPFTKEMAMGFACWYSGMAQEKVIKAFERWEKECSISQPPIQESGEQAITNELTKRHSEESDHRDFRKLGYLAALIDVNNYIDMIESDPKIRVSAFAIREFMKNKINEKSNSQSEAF